MNNKKELIEKLEPFLSKLEEIKVLLTELKEDEPKIDFSILNDEDVFYIHTKHDNEYLFIGKDPFNKTVNAYDYVGNTKRFCSVTWRKNVVELRKATDEEIALYRKHYPVKQKVWIEVYKTVHGDITNIIHESKKDLEYSLKLNGINGIQPLEVIEIEY